MSLPFTSEADAYASLLLDAGFTVYLPTEGGLRGLADWFHYSREVDGQTCYGTYHGSTASLEGPNHSMPITPSRLNGSSAHIGGTWGDEATLGLDLLDVRTVAYAEAVARPSNWCPFNYEPTRENVERANSMRPLPKRAAQGARLNNAEPWGIGTHYLPASVTL